MDITEFLKYFKERSAVFILQKPNKIMATTQENDPFGCGKTLSGLKKKIILI